MSVRTYVIEYVGNREGSTTSSGGNVLLDAAVHSHDGPSHTGTLPLERISTTETDTTKVASPDGTGGIEFVPAAAPNAELNIEGGQDVINALGSVSGAVAVDPTDGNLITLTMTGDTTATLSAPTGSGGSTLEWWVTQDGTGGHDFTIAATGGTVTDDGTITPDTTPGVTVRYITERVPATTNDWIRDLVGGGGGSAIEVLDEGVSLTTGVTSIGFVGAGVTATATGDAVTVTIPGDSGGWQPLMDGGSPYAPLDDGTGTDWLFVFVP